MPGTQPILIQEMQPCEFPQTSLALVEGVHERVAPGFVAGLWDIRDPGRAWVSFHGRFTFDETSAFMQRDTVFDLASLTKVMATTALAALLVDRKWIRWDSKVSSFFPGYPYDDIELRHLLSHTSGLPALSDFWRSAKERFAQVPLASVPVSVRQRAMLESTLRIEREGGIEKRVNYSDVGFILLGFVLEEAVAMPLDRAVQEWVWRPMGVEGAHFRRTTISPEKAVDSRVAPTEISEWHGALLQGQVHDENCWAMGGYGGHAGAFGRVQDVLSFSRSLFGGFFSHGVLNAIWTRVAQPVGCERTLGWDTPSTPEGAAVQESSSGHLFSARSVGHLGFTGTSLWIDPEAGLAVTLLSNRVHPSRENVRIRKFRPKFHDAIRLDWMRLAGRS